MRMGVQAFVALDLSTVWQKLWAKNDYYSFPLNKHHPFQTITLSPINLITIITITQLFFFVYFNKFIDSLILYYAMRPTTSN